MDNYTIMLVVAKRVARYFVQNRFKRATDLYKQHAGALDNDELRLFEVAIKEFVEEMQR